MEPRGDAPVASAARRAAYQAVLAVLRGRGFASASLAARRSFADPRDAGFARHLAQGAVRHLITVEHVLAQVARYEPGFLPAELRAILVLAAYQLIWVDGVPPFAAVHEAVTLAKVAHGRRGGNLVNAILRSLTRAIDGRGVPWQPGDRCQIRTGPAHACALRQPVLPPTDDLVAHLAPHVGERAARFRALAERFGIEQAEAVGWASQSTPPLVLQPNRLRISAAEFEAAVRQAWGDAPEFAAGAALLPPATPLSGSELLQAGLVYVQDVTAHAAAELLGAAPGERILDLCAAPGGKSLALAIAQEDRGEVCACDVAPERVERIAENAARLKLRSVRALRLAPHPSAAGAARQRPPAPPASESPDAALAPTVALEELGIFDAALVDVPCSNTGVIARRPEARLGLTSAKLASLVALQAELLRRAAQAVRPGGRLVYSTCSIEPDENEQIVAGFLSEQTQWRLRSQSTQLPTRGTRLGDWRDGGFAALVENGR